LRASKETGRGVVTRGSERMNKFGERESRRAAVMVKRET